MFVRKSEDRNRYDSGRHDDQRPWRAGTSRLKEVQQDQRPGAEEEGHPICLAQLLNKMPELIDSLAMAVGQPKDLGRLAYSDMDRQPENESGHNRVRNERGNKSESQQPTQQEDNARDENQKD